MFFENAEVLNNYDLIVVGNGLDAVIAAGSAAKSGKTVALVTESELLLSEISESLLGFVNQKSPLYELLLELGASPIKVGDEHHIPSGMGSKIALKYLCENNVNLFLKASPVALLTNANLVCGIVIATKFGAFELRGSFVADFSSRKFYNTTQQAGGYTYAFQMEGVDLSGFNTPQEVECDIEDAKNITIHSDSRSEKTCIITFKTDKKSAAELVEDALLVAKRLIENHSAFSFGGILKYSLRPNFITPSFSTPQKNLLKFCSGDFLSSDDYYNAVCFANNLVNSFTEKAKPLAPEHLVTTYGEFDLAPLYTGDELDSYLGARLLKINLPTENMPCKSAELFIAGLGTGGSAAMKAALKSNASAIGAEALPVPAGTRGQGMVSAFWHGYTNGFARENFMQIKDFSKLRLGKSAPHYTAEIAYDILTAKSATVFYESLVFAALKDSDKTIGVILSTPDGPIKVLANKFIDATGDADLARLAGVEYTKNGDYRDGVTQGYSVWGDEAVGTAFPDSLYKGDEDSISTESYSEFLRGIYIAHLKQSDLGFSALLTVRESRKIKGKYCLNMKDIFRGTVFDDTISVSLCKYDAHGMGSSPAYYTDFFNAMKSKAYPDILTRIPLRALLPEKDSSIMVISKSISATRDAACLIRMNSDIQNTGFAAGMVAAAAAKGNIDFEKAYISDIKNELIKMQNLPDYYKREESITADELIQRIKNNDILAMAIASVHPEYLENFEKECEDSESLAAVCLSLGSSVCFEQMSQSFEAYIADYDKKKIGAEKIKSHAILLSRVAKGDEDKTQRLLPLLAKAIETMDAGGDYINKSLGIYQNSKVSNRLVPNFRAIMALCIAAETLADKSLAKPLISLSKKKNIDLCYGDEIHSVQLYLRIMSAAARCGDSAARTELEKYLNSNRLFFREFAKSELYALSLANSEVVPTEITEFWI